MEQPIQEMLLGSPLTSRSIEVSSSNKSYKTYAACHSTEQNRSYFIDHPFLRGPCSICNFCPRGLVEETYAALLISTRISN